MLPQPGRQRAELIGRLVFVDLLVAARSRRSLFARASIEAQRAIERVVAVLQLEEDLIRLLLILEVRRVERLQEIEVEIAGGCAVDRSLGAPKNR